MSEILSILKEIRAKLDSIEIEVKPIKEDADLYDPDGVLWKNRAMEYKRKLGKLQKQIEEQKIEFKGNNGT